MKKTRVVITAKAPIPGFCKTRLIPTLGPERAAALARKMLLRICDVALKAQVGPVELCVTPAPDHPSWQGLEIPQGIHWTQQAEGDLGQRLSEISQRVSQGNEHCLLVGTDCTEIGSADIRAAAEALSHHEASIIPVSDGGYILLATQRHLPSLFEGIPWGTPAVYELTLQRLQEEGWQVRQGEPLHDIDEAGDLRWLPKDWPESDLV